MGDDCLGEMFYGISNATLSFNFEPHTDDNMKRRVAEKIRGIKKVIYNNPATIVIWNDGSKTVVKCHDGDSYDPVIGLLLCIVRKCSNGAGYSSLCEFLDYAYLLKNSNER